MKGRVTVRSPQNQSVFYRGRFFRLCMVVEMTDDFEDTFRDVHNACEDDRWDVTAERIFRAGLEVWQNKLSSQRELLRRERE